MIRNLQTTLLFVFLFVVGVIVYRQTGEAPSVRDSEEYFKLSKNLINHNIHFSGDLNDEKDFRLYSKRTLGFPLFIAFQFWSITVTYISQGLLLILIYFLGLNAVRKFSESRVTYSIYSIAFLLQGSVLFSVGLLLSDLLLCAVISLAYWVYVSQHRSVNSMLFGGLWALALLVKPVILPSLLLVPVVIYLQKKKTKKWAFGTLLPVLTWAIVSSLSYLNTSQFEYSSISTINLSQYNAKLTVSKSYGYDSAQWFSNSLMDKVPTSIEEYSDYKLSSLSASKAVILDNIKAYLTVHTIGMIKMLLDPGRFELFTFFNAQTSELSLTELLFSGDIEKVNSELQKQPVLFLFFLILLGLQVVKLIGFLFSLRRIKKIWIGRGVIAYFLFITGPVGAARFFIPASMLFSVFVAVGWGELLDFLKKSPKG